MNKKIITLMVTAASLVFMWNAVCAQAAQSVPSVPGTASDNQKPDNGGQSTYCDRNLGKWFYCQSDAPPPSDPHKPDSKASPERALPMAPDEKDLKDFETFKADMDKAKNIAVWNPTSQNLERYWNYQKATLDKAGTFADSWRRMIWENPNMDYDQVRPVSDLGKQTWSDERAADRDLFFRGITEEIGIYYVFRDNCAPCRAQSPIMYNFYTRFGIPIHGISTDGSKNQYFPNAKMDHGQLASWGITKPVSPAFLVFQRSNVGADGKLHQVEVPVSDGKTIKLRPCSKPNGCLTYVGAGVLSVDELADRMFVILGTEAGKDF